MDIIVTALLAGTAIVAFAAAAGGGRILIPILRRLKFGQTIREDGPVWHKAKQGIPTMGGFLFIAGMTLALSLALPAGEILNAGGTGIFPDDRTATRLAAGLALMLACGAIGFADDYIKVVKKRNLGLSGRQKMFALLLVSFGYAFSLYGAGDAVQWIPFASAPVDLGLWFIPICMFIVIGAVNAVNLNDGIDGLCGSVSFIAGLPFIILAAFDGAVGMGLIAAALCGALLGYLIWNFYPAKVIMGDVGAFYIGAALCAVAFGLRRPLLLIPVGIIYIAEAVSVILQVGYFKLTRGRRLFKMSPIHHHFELCGWRENKIVAVFAGITMAGCAAALLIELMTR